MCIVGKYLVEPHRAVNRKKILRPLQAHLHLIEEIEGELRGSPDKELKNSGRGAAQEMKMYTSEAAEMTSEGGKKTLMGPQDTFLQLRREGCGGDDGVASCSDSPLMAQLPGGPLVTGSLVGRSSSSSGNGGV